MILLYLWMRSRNNLFMLNGVVCSNQRNLWDLLIILLPFPLEGKVFVSPPVAAVEEGESRWNSSLVGQFLDKALPFFLVKKYVQLMWKQYGDVEVFSVENGMFIFRFADVASCDEVFESKLWYVVNKPLIIRKWTPGMQVLKLTMSSIPIWVKFMHLPLEYWTKTCLSHVASGVGKPLCADRVTEEQQRLGYARVLVEIDVNSVCPKEIFISRANGTNLSIGVEYPWLPPKCSGCGGFGHATYVCPNTKKENKVWMPKKIFHDILWKGRLMVSWLFRRCSLLKLLIELSVGPLQMQPGCLLV
jgi:hypothetical protein